jgi:diphosphate-dependent phosphofructokinase
MEEVEKEGTVEKESADVAKSTGAKEREVKRVAILTAGGIAPCLAAAVGALIERYTEIDPNIEILCYKNGYHGLLLGHGILVNDVVRHQAHFLQGFGGSPIGNSRVKLTNVADCVKKGLIKAGEDPLKVAAEQLMQDRIDVLHVIGGDDTNTTAADLAKYLKENAYELCVVGLPKTVDNDIYPIKQTLGAHTAAVQGARFFENIVAEQSANPNMLIVHEVMGRHSGWLTFATAQYYHKELWSKKIFLPELGFNKELYAIHGMFVPEVTIDIPAEAARLKATMKKYGCVNIFVSEGAGVQDILAMMERNRDPIPRDAFGHVKLDAINPGKWFGDQFGKMIGASKILVQKSGYFARSAPPELTDIRLIQSMVDSAVASALKGESGVIGHDSERNNQLRCIEFDRVKGGKVLDVASQEYKDLVKEIRG